MKNEKNLKYGIKTVSYVLIVALFFAIGYNAGKICRTDGRKTDGGKGGGGECDGHSRGEDGI